MRFLGICALLLHAPGAPSVATDHLPNLRDHTCIPRCNFEACDAPHTRRFCAAIPGPNPLPVTVIMRGTHNLPA
ncbi:hypothetical protein DFH09DRAFT_113667 [Mycena vulgaris]|nr:hypothetical protein DFH09DRAFT_113667 [Mycena vulgaris]